VEDVATAAFLAAASANAGFQATVTTVVYPALSRVRAAHWRQAHDRHSRAVAPLVAVLYLALVATSVWWLVDDWSSMALVAVVLAGLPAVVTALVAAPLHRRMVRRDEAALARLLVADRVRTALALAAVAAGFVAALVD
jgi:hypothetical protein